MAVKSRGCRAVCEKYEGIIRAGKRYTYLIELSDQPNHKLSREVAGDGLNGPTRATVLASDIEEADLPFSGRLL